MLHHFRATVVFPALAAVAVTAGGTLLLGAAPDAQLRGDRAGYRTRTVSQRLGDAREGKETAEAPVTPVPRPAATGASAPGAASAAPQRQPSPGPSPAPSVASPPLPSSSPSPGPVTGALKGAAGAVGGLLR